MKTHSKIFLMMIISVVFGCSKKTLKSETKSRSKQTLEIDKAEEKEIVIEGTVISAKRNFYKNAIYSSCVVEVNTIFQGDLKEKVIEVFVAGGTIGERKESLSHGQIILPPKNATAIFRIREFKDDNPRKEFKDLTPYKLFYSATKMHKLFPIDISGHWKEHMEKKLYQKLEKESGRKRKVVLPKKTIDEIAINYSAKNGLLLPNRKTGIVYKLRPINETKKENFIGFNLNIASSNKDTYLQRGEIIVEYNIAAFGDSIVSRKNLNYNIPRNFKKKNSSRANAIPQHFDVKIFDVSPNQFKIQWLNTSSPENCLQLLPSKKGIYSMQLYFKPQHMDEHLIIHLKSDELQNLHYDYQTESIVPYDYVATDKMLDQRVNELMPATITHFDSEKIYQTYDTLRLGGKNFGSHAVVSFYSKGTRGPRKYRRMPETFIISRSDTLIQLIIPPLTLMERGSDFSEEWIPTNGQIMITKGHVDFQVKTWSKQKIKIK